MNIVYSAVSNDNYFSCSAGQMNVLKGSAGRIFCLPFTPQFDVFKPIHTSFPLSS